MKNKWLSWKQFQTNENAVEDIIFTHETAKDSLANSKEVLKVGKKSFLSFFNFNGGK